MRCQKCNCERSSVVDSRGDGLAIRRRRECQECGFRYTTYERVEFILPMVVKKNGDRETFERRKLLDGIRRACEKRPVGVQQVEQAVTNIEKHLQELCVKEVPAMKIGELVMEELKRLDKIAYVRFASVYREFSDVSEFVSTLESLGTSEERPERRAKESEGGESPSARNDSL